ncbi:VC0807 family protein [Rapidithrix thailandica]|uniref:VC0807 family protein n=1 Tax=Rapidithrix thailandica TaxID=413964 RepID=A0AAW9SBT3_9BACT
MNEESKTVDKAEARSENPLMNLIVNIVIPSVVLMKFSGEEYLGPTRGLVIALAFPLVYGIVDFVKSKKVNFISILGFVSVLFTGVVGLMELDAHLIAIKEAAIPLIIGLAIIISLKTPFPLVRKLIYNDKILDVAKISTNLEERGNSVAFEKKLVLASYLLAGSFFLSAVLNYVLARIILVSDPGTVAFNEELGKMTAYSFPVIALPSTLIMLLILWFLINRIKRLTGLELQDIFRN